MANIDLARFFPTSQDITAETAINAVLKVEGGYVNHKNDRGGETNLGITKTTAIMHKHLWSKHGFNGDMRYFPKGLAFDIYYESFWRKAGCDTIEQYDGALAYQVFDVAVNMGVFVAVRYLQQALNTSNVTLYDNQGQRMAKLVEDGKMGPGTRQAIVSYFEQCGNEGTPYLLYEHLSLQEKRYHNIVARNPSQKVFLKGWLNRIASKQKYYDKFYR